MRQTLLILFAALVLRTHAQQAAPYLIDAKFDTGWAYVGQAVTYTVIAYSDTARDVAFVMPPFTGFWQADARAFGGSATRDGKQYNTAIYQVRLYPQQAGLITLGAARAEFAETVFSAGANRLSNLAALEVLELPPGPQDFSGLVGVVAADFSAAPVIVRLGEPVSASVTLRGTANLAQLLRPALIAPQGWRIYTEPGSADSEIDDNLLLQTRIVRWQAIPDRAGRAVLSLPPLSIFDPDRGYTSVEVSPVEIEVLPGPDGELSRESQTQIVESLLIPASPQGAAGDVTLWLWMIGPLAALAAVGGRAGLRRWTQARAASRKRSALKRAASRLRQAAQSDDGLLQIEVAVRGYFSDHAATVADEPEAARLLLNIEGERYNRQGAARAAAFAKQALELLRRVEAARND